MRGQDFLDKMALVDPAYVEAANAKPVKKKQNWMKWEALAACLCLVAATALMLAPQNSPRAVLQWSENFLPESYFRYNLGADDSVSVKSIVDSDIIYAASRDFSDFRSQMEADEVIPVMPNHPLYTCTVRYNEDGSILSITFSWHQRGESYSDLSITVGYQEVEQIQDYVFVEIDEDGNIVPPSVTVTERDGIQIIAKGNENGEKTLTFQTETAWYQIAGSGWDGYEAMGALLDWVWEHPICFDLFTMEKGIEIRDSSLEEYPGAFAGCIPDFPAFGYFLGQNCLRLKDGIPYTFEGHYYTGVEKTKVDDGSYLFEDGWTEIHWCIDTEPDYYDLQSCLGDISELSEQQIADVLSEKSFVSFLVDGCFVKVYCKDAKAVWEVLGSLTKRPR